MKVKYEEVSLRTLANGLAVFCGRQLGKVECWFKRITIREEKHHERAD